MCMWVEDWVRGSFWLHFVSILSHRTSDALFSEILSCTVRLLNNGIRLLSRSWLDTFNAVPEALWRGGVIRRNVKGVQLQTVQNILGLWQPLHHGAWHNPRWIPPDQTALCTLVMKPIGQWYDFSVKQQKRELKKWKEHCFIYLFCLSDNKLYTGLWFPSRNGANYYHKRCLSFN